MSIFVAPRRIEPLPAKAGPIGTGAGVLMTEYPLMSILGQNPHQKMRTAYQMGMNVPWIRRAESLIGSKVATIDFDLDDPDDTEIDGAYPNADAVAAWELLNRPQAKLEAGQPLSRSALWRITSRHLGLAGNAFWLLDQPEAFSGTPQAIAYLRPDRMTPDEDAAGNLVGWIIDKSPTSRGIPVALKDIVHFMLEPPDSGHFGPGLIETALLTGQLSSGLDRHLASVISAGGRLSGFLSPKQGVIEGDILLQLERDWRTITEQPDAAKRLQLIAAPIDFTPTTMTPAQLDLVKLIELERDNLLAFWNVPGPLIGVKEAGGLRGGETRKYDEASLWQGPVHDRLIIIGEGIEDQILTKWQTRLGWVPEIIFEEPEFDDDTPKYELAAKAVTSPLKSSERRAILGLEPFGDQRDDEVWLPINLALAYSATGESDTEVAAPVAPKVAVEVGPDTDRALHAAGETTEGKATLDRLHRSLVSLRQGLDARYTPRFRNAVAEVLDEQRREVAAKLRAKGEHVTANPSDVSVWWNARKWDERLTAALGAHVANVAQTVTAHIGANLAPVKADPIDAADLALTRGAARVTAINERTRQAIVSFISQGIVEGLSPSELGDRLEAGVLLDNGVSAFDTYRAEMIARTELMDAYNGAALASYSDAGITMVQAIDGDQDEECAARNGREFSILDADGIEDHPNGTLDWVPVVKASDLEPAPLPAKAGTGTIHRETFVLDIPAPVVNVSPPEVHIKAAEAPVIHVAAPIVNVPAPIVDMQPVADMIGELKVLLAPKPPLRKVVTRDAEGLIASIEEVP